MASGQTFTVGTQFGGGGTPTYNGQTIVQPPANGNVAINPQVFIPAGNSDVIIYTEPIVAANVQGYGAYCKTINQVGANTPQVTVKFKVAAVGNTDLSYVLSAGQAVGFPNNTAWVYNSTSIRVTPDPYSNTEVDIVVIVTS